MSRVASVSISSLLEKLRTYCRYAGANGAPPDFAEFIESPAASQHGVVFLRGLSKEVDVWSRELLSPAQQDDMVRAMRAAGVLDGDLPSTERTRAVRRLLKLKRPLRSEELLLARRAADEWQSLSLSTTERHSLTELVSGPAR